LIFARECRLVHPCDALIKTNVAKEKQACSPPYLYAPKVLDSCRHYNTGTCLEAHYI